MNDKLVFSTSSEAKAKLMVSKLQEFFGMFNSLCETNLYVIENGGTWDVMIAPGKLSYRTQLHDMTMFCQGISYGIE